MSHVNRDTKNDYTRLYKLQKSGNGTKISDEKWRSAKTKYLEMGTVKCTGIMNA